MDDLFVPGQGLAYAEISAADSIAARLGYTNGRAYLLDVLRRAIVRDSRKTGVLLPVPKREKATEQDAR